MNILALDIGNTRTSLGFFVDSRFCSREDIETGCLLDDLGRIAGMPLDCCVISRVSQGAAEAETRIRQVLRCNILGMSTSDSPIPIEYTYPERLGCDRLANVLGARIHAPSGAIVVDLGTATHFDVLDAQGRFYGGPILLGVESMANALVQRIPHLPTVSVHSGASVIAEDTESAIHAGVIYGTAGTIERVVDEIKKQLKFDPQVILTGGNAEIIAPYVSYDIWAPNLTLEGMCQYALFILQRESNRISA